LVIIVPLIQDVLTCGQKLLWPEVLYYAALPTIITISEDAMRNTPRAMKEASLALSALALANDI
jgi:phosphate transport system permease protein